MYKISSLNCNWILKVLRLLLKRSKWSINSIFWHWNIQRDRQHRCLIKKYRFQRIYQNRQFNHQNERTYKMVGQIKQKENCLCITLIWYITFVLVKTNKKNSFHFILFYFGSDHFVCLHIPSLIIERTKVYLLFWRLPITSLQFGETLFNPYACSVHTARTAQCLIFRKNKFYSGYTCTYTYVWLNCIRRNVLSVLVYEMCVCVCKAHTSHKSLLRTHDVNRNSGTHC